MSRVRSSSHASLFAFSKVALFSFFYMFRHHLLIDVQKNVEVKVSDVDIVSAPSRAQSKVMVQRGIP